MIPTNFKNLAVMFFPVLLMFLSMPVASGLEIDSDSATMEEALSETEAVDETAFISDDMQQTATAEADTPNPIDRADEISGTVVQVEVDLAPAPVTDAIPYQETAMEPVAAESFPLTEDERALVHKAVMAESRGESYEGQMMVAQAIRDGAERNGFDVATSIRKYKIATINIAPTPSVQEAVSAVFDDGERVTEEKADLWYAYELVNSGWHEKQQYVTTIGVHRFFWCNSDIG